MRILVKALHPLFAGEVSGVDLRLPVDLNVFLEIEAALDRDSGLDDAFAALG